MPAGGHTTGRAQALACIKSGAARAGWSGQASLLAVQSQWHGADFRHYAGQLVTR